MMPRMDWPLPSRILSKWNIYRYETKVYILDMKRKFIVIAVLLSFFLLSFHYVPFLSTFSREQFWQIFAVLSLGSSIIAFWGTWRGFTILPLLVLPTLYPLGITFFLLV